MSRILKDFLSAAGVEYTASFADKLFRVNPNRDSLLGLKQMLNAMGIKTQGVRVKDGETKGLSFPCILHVKDDFLVATECTEQHLTYMERGRKKRMDMATLREVWDGYALYSTNEVFPKSAPTNKSVLFLDDEMSWEWMPFIYILSVITIWGVVVQNALHAFDIHPCDTWEVIAPILMGLLAAAGFAVSAFLAEKEVKGESRIGDRLCRLLGDGKCTQAPKKDGKLFGLLPLSEAGLGYFGGQILAISFLEDGVLSSALFSMVALLFCPWSILTQWKSKQWCSLCLLVVAVLVMQGVESCFLLEMPERPDKMLNSALVMILCTLMAHLLMNSMKREGKAKQKTDEYHAFCNRRAIFRAAIRHSTHRIIEERDIYWREGNKKAEFSITLVSSNHCPHCTNKYLQFIETIDNLKDFFLFEHINLSEMTPQHLDEFIARTGINATPVVLVDDHDLPEVYDIDDLYLLI